jgi:hypothetical protein
MGMLALGGGLAIAWRWRSGVPQDYVQAHMWLNLAAAHDDEVKLATVARDELAAKMTPDQIAEAQRMAREWKPGRAQRLASPDACSPFEDIPHRRRLPLAARAVATPRALRASAIWRSVLAPAASASRIAGRTVSACASAPATRPALMAAQASTRRGLPSLTSGLCGSQSGLRALA